MAESFKDKVDDAALKIGEAATKAGHVIGEKVEKAADWAKEKTHEAGHRIEETTHAHTHATGTPLGQSTGATGSVADIKEHMDVYASCGTKVGKVDHVMGDKIELTKNDSPDGKHHFIPTSWVAKVHDHVHLSKDHLAVHAQWKDS